MDGGIREGRDSGEHPGTGGWTAAFAPAGVRSQGWASGGVLPGYPSLTWAASALFLGPSDVHTHAPRRTRLLAHTCTHADKWSLDPEGTRPGAFRGQLGTCRPLACAWSPLPPPAHLPRLHRAGVPPSGGWGLKPWGPQRLSHLPVKQHQAKSCCIPAVQNRAPGRAAFPPKERRNIFKEKALCRLGLFRCRCVPPISCTRFFLLYFPSRFRVLVC